MLRTTHWEKYSEVVHESILKSCPSVRITYARVQLPWAGSARLIYHCASGPQGLCVPLFLPDVGRALPLLFLELDSQSSIHSASPPLVCDNEFGPKFASLLAFHLGTIRKFQLSPENCKVSAMHTTRSLSVPIPSSNFPLHPVSDSPLLNPKPKLPSCTLQSPSSHPMQSSVP